jgi:hypothetical protein
MDQTDGYALYPLVSGRHMASAVVGAWRVTLAATLTNSLRGAAPHRGLQLHHYQTNVKAKVVAAVSAK